MEDHLIINDISIRYSIERVSVGSVATISINVFSHFIELWQMAAKGHPVKVDFVLGDWNMRVTGSFKIEEYGVINATASQPDNTNCTLTLQSFGAVNVEPYATLVSSFNR